MFISVRHFRSLASIARYLQPGILKLKNNFAWTPSWYCTMFFHVMD